MNRIDERFAALRKQGRKGFVAYIGAGDPNLEATRQLGARFDIRDFHETVLGGGAMPLSMLSGEVERWISARK